MKFKKEKEIYPSSLRKYLMFQQLCKTSIWLNKTVPYEFKKQWRREMKIT